MVENNENIFQSTTPTEQNYEAAPLDTGTDQETIQVQQHDEPSAEQPKPVDTPENRNWREIRNKNEQLQRERDEAIRMLQYHEQRTKEKKYEAPEEEAFDLADDDLVEGKQVKKYLKRELTKMQSQINTTRESSADLELKQRYPDIVDIVSHENIALLNSTFPELAESLAMNPDYKTKAIATYNAIKNMGIAKRKSVSEESMKLEKNVAKPRSINTANPQAGDTPLSRAHNFYAPISEDLKRQLYEDALKKSRGG